MTFEKLTSEFSKKIHFIGIGGIGMSALALLLNKINIKVQGSDLRQNYMTPTLQNAGISYFVGHDAKNIDEDVELIVKTSIIKEDNPEIIEAKKRGIKIITRAQLLAKVMSFKKSITAAGTHGKTSTTALIATIIEGANLDPIVINGGVINEYKSNYKLGNGDFIVAESDESDGSFVILPTFIGAITNIEPEHLEFYKHDFNAVLSHFEQYVKQIPQNSEGSGLCAMCIDNENVENIYQKLKLEKNNLLSYSVKKDADVVAKNIVFETSGSKFDVVFKNGKVIKDIHLSAYGLHNVSNSLAAIAIADFLQISEDVIKKSLYGFKGVQRRFSKVGEVDGVVIIDDYAHHPTEILATLNSARQFAQKNQIILVLQPHKYTRVQDLFEEFATCVKEADMVILDEIYAASQEPIAGISQDSLLAKIQEKGHKNAIKLAKKEDLAKIIKENAKKGDLVLCAGAGSITYMAHDLVGQLEQLK
jgi:UDP-N-acetylmuramate--alanine ligase